MPTVIYLNRYVDFRSKDSYNFGNKNLTIWVSLDRSTRWKQLGRTICATRIPKTSWIMKMPVPIPHNYLAPIQSSSTKMWTTDCCRHDCFCSPIILEKSVYMSCGPKKKGGGGGYICIPKSPGFPSESTVSFRVSLKLFIHPNRNPCGNLDADDQRENRIKMLKRNSVLPCDTVPVTVMLFTINFLAAKYHFVEACCTNQPSILTSNLF